MNNNKLKFLLIAIGMILFSSCNQTQLKKAEYSGEDIRHLATIERDKDTKNVQLVVKENIDWKLYTGESVDKINLSEPILTGDASGFFSIDSSVNQRPYFLFETSKGTMLMAERHLPMAGGYNFRDLGGFRTKDGKYTQWGKIFRSDDLNHLTDEDLNYLASIPLVTIVDFRSPQEITEAPDKNPSSLKNNVQLSIAPGNLSDANQLAAMPELEMEQFMMDLNELLVTDSVAIDAYKQMFAMLQSETDIPLMYHCSAGKDRTGMGTALIFYALGVDEETIIQDYLASNYYLGDKYAPMKAKYPNLAPLLEVRSNYLQAGLNKIKEEYGSIDAFLTDVLKVDIVKMKEMYLY